MSVSGELERGYNSASRSAIMEKLCFLSEQTCDADMRRRHAHIPVHTLAVFLF